MKTIRIMLISGLVASCAVGTHASHPSQAPSETIAVAEFVIDPQSLPGTTEGPQRDVMIRHLEDEATDQAVRTLHDHHLATVIKRVSTPADAMDVPVVSGDIRMPVDLPDGTVKMGNPISLSWSAVWWTEGGRARHSVPRDQVLAGFARKAADRGVREMLAVPHIMGG